jgi:hypothetical protein
MSRMPSIDAILERFFLEKEDLERPGERNPIF